MNNFSLLKQFNKIEGLIVLALVDALDLILISWQLKMLIYLITRKN